ncbi:MAG: enoyl-CoA hydratase-related protein [Desulfuromonadaceae bacterium]|nr:enoyl-CoA hydratase-related protein [Desulfuromonadaceae bacterium]MDD2856899.1 enoyl-CoA hydratase-related protein [Desulfuromonadaceae bacterium]
MPERICSTQYRVDGIAVLTITGNAAASAKELLEAVRRHIGTVELKEDVKGIILTDSYVGFCRCVTERPSSLHYAAGLSVLGQQTATNIEKTGKPCIAVFENECSGIGLELALACDFIVASETATFGFPDIELGLIPFCGGSQRLSRLVGKSKTKELIYSGDLIDAAEAHRIGLINRIYPEGEALLQAEKLLAHICTRSPNAIRIGGEIVNAGYDIDLQTACMMERDAFALCFASFDQREGMQAFLEKRPPHFKGE